MRFRGKDENGNWVFGGIDGGGEFIISHYQFIPVICDTITRSTGFQDINGEEIYEGDIIENRYDKQGNSREEILWDEQRGKFCTKRIVDGLVSDCFADTIKRTMVIVGTIFD